MHDVQTDIVIAGGGLAGMSLALQLHNTLPDLDIVVIEKNRFPVPDTTAKVGESTVEIGSHYLTHVLGLQAHFEQHHLQKHGLRCFFGNHIGDYSDYDELGVSELFGIPTYQIERGVLENHLHQLLIERGIQFIDGAVPADITLGNKDHRVVCRKDGEDTRYACRWVIDAAGRQALLKNKLQLHEDNGHEGNAVFFRVDKRILIDDWTENTAWQQRVNEKGTRWLSTNHLMGPGYWIWIIPLASGATSFGVVMDDKALAESGIETYEDTLAWLQKQHPTCAGELADAPLLDFKVINGYSYGCKQVFSDNGWALTGEAGVFADPFYSPGSDFIALSNTFITQLVKTDMTGGNTQLESLLFEKFYRSFYENTLSLYKHQYGGFGDRGMMSVKLVWDYTYYWGVLSLLFFTQSITDIELMRDLNPLLMRARKLNTRMQTAMQTRAQKRQVIPAKGVFLDQFLVPCLVELNTTLKATDIDVEAALARNVEIMEQLVPYLEDMLTDEPVSHVDDEEADVLGQYRHQVLA
ncbi:NAD(P)/FAD-dependent oxidoreductase [Alteromonas halophila]|uniref:Halogenase n=1 Tax=Alteromonas halophila TaxID=516698 RepID=A0A918JKE6_9ALTE|nr:tryptophan 7-halogenase [Alteromonas halophila]GGW84907.1 halogenase [Alteromonas halophila]